MKWLPLFCCLLGPLAAFADDTPKSDLKPLKRTVTPNVQIIDGKKFFSLSNARHFTGSFNDPKALSVMHHPRPEGTIASRHISPLPFSPSGSGKPQSPDTSQKVLSVFAPDDKSGQPPAAR